MKNHREAVRPLTADDIIVGGGELGALIRAKDWSSTPLGPVQTWPQSLRSAVSILLPSRAQIVLFWGSDLIALYNDAYRPAFGVKHPWALGRPARECWSEVWDVIGPLFESVVRTGEAFWAADHPFFLERHGYLEETYFDVSYDPVRDESGSVGGLFCIVSETTGRVLGSRRLTTLRELGVQTGGLETADAVCLSAAQALAVNQADIPYALVYLLVEDGRARLVASMGATPREEAREIDLRSGDPRSVPFVQVITSQEAVEAAPEVVVADLPADSVGERMLVLPLTSGTSTTGFLVTGVSQYLALEGDYRDFFDLVSSRISAALAGARAFEEKHRRAEALAELDRAKTAFFCNVSHEFRTPLTLMLGPLEDALAGRGLPQEEQDRLAMVHRNGLRLLKLVNTLLDFTRIEAGRVEASYEPTDLAEVTAELAGVFRSAIEQAGLRLVIDCPPLAEPVYVDHDMWEKIVLNLLSNAFKFTFGGEIVVRLRAMDGQVVLEVRDTGNGIPDDALPHLFERFHRVQGVRSRTHEGTGIGLALVQELVRLHGGTIRVESAVGVGSTFTIALPRGSSHLPAGHIQAVRPLSSTATAAKAYVREAVRWLPGADSPELDVTGLDDLLTTAVAPVPAAQGGRVLLADDNADMRDYVTRLLSPHWTIEAVADGTTALTAARERPPDLVLSDVMMPGLDGFALLRELRADPRTSRIPVVLLSARAGQESRVEGLESGADDYLIKPFSARELVARVATHLQMARMREEAAGQVLAANEALTQKQAVLQEVIARAPAGIALLWGPDLRYRLVNERYAQWFLGKGDFLGRPLADVFSEAATPFLPLLDGVLKTGEPFRGTDLPVPFGDELSLDGFRYFTFTCTAVPAPDGTIGGVLAVALETTEEVRRRRQLEQELEAKRTIAETLQHSLMLERLPKIPGIAIAARYVPGGAGLEVGGDWYDVLELPRGEIGLVVGDVAGKGMRAAAVMGQLRNALRAYALEGRAPAAVLNQLHRLMDPADMATVLYLIVDPATWAVRWANAGHPPPMVLAPNGGVTPLTNGSPPLGGAWHAVYTEHTAQIVPGSTLLLYTDGLVEVRGQLLDERLALLQAFLADGAHREVEDLTEHVLQALLGKGTPGDDVAMLAVRLSPLSDERLHLRVPATPRAVPAVRQTLGRWLKAQGVPEPQTFEMTVACTEAVMNAIEHAYGGVEAEVEVELTHEAGEILFTVRDFGKWRAQREKNRGYGLSLIHTLMESVDIASTPEGTTVQMRRRVRPRVQA